MTDEQTARTAELMDMPTTADTLRALADWLDEHPTAKPYVDLSLGVGNARILDFQTGREELVTRAAEIGGRWEKDISDTYFWMRQEIVPGVSYDLYSGRDVVCERVVVGTEEVEVPDPDFDVPKVTVVRERVEWVCPDSLLGTEPTTYADGTTDATTREIDAISDALMPFEETGA